MARDCASCTAPGFGPELDRQLKAGVPLTLVSAWAAEQGLPISTRALARHRRDHLALVTRPGRRPVAGRLLEEIVAQGEEGLENRSLHVGLREAIAATKALDARASRNVDRDIMLRITMALTGQVASPRPIDPELEAFEAELRPLLGPGGGV